MKSPHFLTEVMLREAHRPLGVCAIMLVMERMVGVRLSTCDAGRVVHTGIKKIKIIHNNPGKQSEDQYGGDPSEDVGPPFPPVIDQQPFHVSPHGPADRHRGCNHCCSIGSMMSSIFFPGCSLSWAPYIDGCFSSGSGQCSLMLRVPSLIVPRSKTQVRWTF